MRRGFKAEAERIASRLRGEMDLPDHAPIDPRTFIGRQGIEIIELHELTGLTAASRHQLEVRDPNSWSGLTLREGSTTVILVNPTHSLGRQANTLMHEWAHIHLRHKPNRVDFAAGEIMLLSDYPAEFEQEADWLAAAALLPRSALVRCRRQSLENEQIAERYGVSKELVVWRIRMTGIDRQFRRRA